MSAADWRILVGNGFWQATSALDKSLECVLGHIRVRPDAADTTLAVKDPFFTVVHLLDAGANPDIAKLSTSITMLLLPRNASGQHYFVTSDLPATASIETMLRYVCRPSG